VDPKAKDFFSYRLSVEELISHGLIFVDARGISYLTDGGVNLCKEHRQEIAQEELYYRHFVAAPM
jgi:hypothetical protein